MGVVVVDDDVQFAASNSRASKRVDQYVTPSRAGGGSSVAAMIAASSIVLGRPDRSAS